MKGFYLDTNVLIPLVVTESSSYAMQAFVTEHGGLLTSEFAAAEAASGVSRLVRMGQLQVDRARTALEDLDDWRLSATEQAEMLPGDIRHAHLLVRRFETKLRAPDALHIAMAKRLGAMLVTRDAGMRAAAEMVGVTAVEPT